MTLEVTDDDGATLTAMRAVEVWGPDPYSIFEEGLVAAGDIYLHGNGNCDINLWARGDIDITPAALAIGRAAWAGGNRCVLGKDLGGPCATFQLPPDLPAPDLEALRNQGLRPVACVNRVGPGP